MDVCRVLQLGLNLDEYFVVHLKRRSQTMGENKR